MKNFDTKDIKNVALIGHQGSGKTSLAEAMLYVTGLIEKKGSIENKNTVSDFLQEEIQKQTSFQTSLIPVIINDKKINILDTPGQDEFNYDVRNALSVCKGAVLVIDSTKGVEVNTIKVWNQIKRRHIPGFIFLNKMDKENINYEKLLENIREHLGKKAVPFTLPIGKEEKFEGFINVITKKAYKFDEQGKPTEVEVYPDKIDRMNSIREQIIESVVTTDEVLMEKYFSGEEITNSELVKGLKQAVFDGELIPVLCGTATKNIGVRVLLNMLADDIPNLTDLKDIQAYTLEGEKVTRKTDDNGLFSAYVFKTLIDPFVGIINFIKVNSGTLSVNQEVYSKDKKEVIKINNLYYLVGKKQIPVQQVHAGDIVCTFKQDLRTNDTLSDPKAPVYYDFDFKKNPVYYIAITPKDKKDEDKISEALNKLNIENPFFDIVKNAQTKQQLIGGNGENHINFILERLNNLYKVQVDKQDPKVLYKESIKKQVEAEGKHKKQSGGAGQFGHVFIRFSPSYEKDLEFEEEIFGGSVPKNYHPAVLKGLQEAVKKGPLGGFEVINLKAVLFDGSYHPVDSNEISFKLAAEKAFKEGIKNAEPYILEPIYEIRIESMDKYVGDILQDINKKRGKVLSMDQRVGTTVVKAEVPESEILKYAIELKALTQGQATFTRKFVKYEKLPKHLEEKVIKENKID